MSIHHLRQNNQPFENYRHAIKEITDLSVVTADIRRHVKGDWRQLEVGFGARSNYSGRDGLNLNLRLRLGLVANGEIDCHVEIDLLNHGYSFDLNSGELAGFSAKLLQPNFPQGYQDFLARNYPDQMSAGFGFIYQYTLLNSENGLVDFWQQIGKSVAAQVEHEAELHHNGNPLNDVTREVIRLSVCLAITTVMNNYFFSTTGQGEAVTREAYMRAYTQDTGQTLDPRDVYNTLELAYIRDARRFAYKAQTIDYKGAHIALTQNDLLASTNIGKMYDTYLNSVPGVRIDPETNALIPLRFEQAVLHNYNPAVLLALAENLWKSVKVGSNGEVMTKAERIDCIVDAILGYQETIGYQNMILADPKNQPIAMDLNHPLVREMFRDTLKRYLQGFKE